MEPLSRDQIEFFRREGYLLLTDVFSPEETIRLRTEADYILELIINSSLANQRRSGRLDWRQTSQSHQQIVRKIQPINDLSLVFSQLAEDQRLKGPLGQLMGEEPVLMEEKLNYKQPLPQPVEGLPIQTIDDSFPIHNDWAYYKAQNYPKSILSSALLIDPCTPDNGPLRVWPGTHHQHLEHERVENGLQVKPGLIDFAGGEDLLAPAGSFIIFSALTVHNSRPNLAGIPRRLMIYSHYPQSFDMPFDVRNSGARLRESPYEREYMRRQDQIQASFKAPVYN